MGFRIHIISMRRPREDFTHAGVKRIQAGVDYLPSTIMDHLPELMFHNLALAVKKPGKYFKAVCQAGIRFMRTRKSATLKHLLQAGYLTGQTIVVDGGSTLPESQVVMDGFYGQ